MDNTSVLLERGRDSSLSATDLLIGVMEFLQDRKDLRVVVLVMEQGEDDEEFSRFTNARSFAEEEGIMRLCREKLEANCGEVDEDE